MQPADRIGHGGLSAPGQKIFFLKAIVVLGGAIIFVGIIANLHIYFRPTSLFNTLIMLGLLVGGLGLIARALRAH
jgi:ATP/ADP translocase